MEQEVNPAYALWLAKDQHLLGYINISLTGEVLAPVSTMTSSAEVWSAIQKMYASQSRSHFIYLRSKLATTRKADMTVSVDFNKMKGYADEMVAARKTLEDDDLISYILAGLDSDYNPMVEHVTGSSEPV